ncbi:T9SS type B sorting domain-containing protein [Capnocytophaga sp. H4358]|uniref:T9SS type B sorting domain-containing protein n=1 Tax=Capnocytophaga sp. H4358 TaxID=1945658 RepID=UPI0012FFA1D7|nr:T9SS type B sorting domain-containing protein [Capnocytophaga sp. H4358]
MKKLFIFVSFMMLTTSWIYAQCDSTHPINGFQLVTGNIQCENRGLITLNAPPVSTEHPAGTEFTVYWVKPGTTLASPRGTVLAGQSMTIPNLAAGTYTFTLEDEANMSCEKPVTINDLYIPFQVKSISVTPAGIKRDPVTNTNVDDGRGSIIIDLKRFTTGASKFQIRVISADTGAVLIHDRVFPTVAVEPQFRVHPAPGERISHADHPNVSVFIREIPPGAPDNDCRNYASPPQGVQIPKSVYFPGTYSLTLSNLALSLHTTTRNVGGTNVLEPTGNFNLTIPLRRGVDNEFVATGFIGGVANPDIPINHFKGVGSSNAKATIAILNRSIVRDITSTFDGRQYSYINADFQENDQVQIVVDDGLGNIVTKTFEMKGIKDVHQETPPTRGMRFSYSASPATPVCPGAPVFLQIKTYIENSERNVTLNEGGTLKINYNWYLPNLEHIWNTTSSTSTLTYQYKVSKETPLNSGVYTLLTQGSDYTIVDYRTIDVQSSGEGRYKIRMEFLKADGTVVTAFERATNSVKYLPTPPNRFDSVFNTFESNYGIAEGTTSFRIYSRSELVYEDPAYPGVSTVTFTLGRVDGQTSVSFPTRLPFGQTKTETINFPISATLTPTYMGDPNGYIGFGDLPPGNYILTVKDACGSASKTITLGKTISYGNTQAERPFYKLVPRCGYYDLEFTHEALGTNFPALTNSMFTGVIGVFSNWNVEQNITKRGRNGTITGLKPGHTYKLYTHGFGGYTIHNKPSSATTAPWTLLSTFSDVIGPGKQSIKFMNSYIYNPNLLRYYTEITVPSQTMDPVVASISCGSNGTSMILVDLPSDTNVGIVGDVTYVLKSVSGTTETEVASVTMTGGQRDYAFTDLPDGTYKVYVKDECVAGDPVVGVLEVADSSVLPTPRITNDDHVAGLCPGEATQLRLRGVSVNSFDVEWYRINPDGSKVMVASNTQTYSEAVYTNTTYEVRAKLKDRFGCATNVWLTATSTSVLAIDTGVPSVTYFPSDISDYPVIGGCDVLLTWNAPQVTDESIRCGVETTVSSTVSITTTFNGGAQHQGRFPIGVHSVVYTFTDVFGNAVSRTLIVTVQDHTMDMKLAEEYSLNPLQVGNEFYYRVKYVNTGAVTLTSAILEVQLPSNANVQPDLTKQVDFTTNAGVSSVPYTYDSATKKYTFTYPAVALPAPGGHQERSIGIPLKIVGGYDLAQQPCMNQVNIIPTMVYTGGVAGCTLRTQTATIQTPTVVEIKTIDNKRTEIYCVGNPMTLSVTPGFDEYKWFLNGTPVGTNTNTFVANAQGEYRVEKYKFDCGVATIVSYEIIDYHEPGSSADPIKALAANVGVTCRNDNRTWTSHFYLCGGTSKTIAVNFVNSTLTWEKLNPSASGLNCQPRHETCPVVIDGCWEEVSNNTNTFTLSQGGRYRLKVAGANCYDFYYFDVFDSSIPAATVTYGDETGYVDGYININMSTQGVNYNYAYTNITTGATGAITTNTTQHRFTGLKAGTYVVKITSPEALLSCLDHTQTITIQKNTNLKFTAEFVEWKSCNEAKMKFKGEGGNPPYQFAVWSVDGEVLAPGGSHMNIPDSEWVGDQGEFDAHYEGLMNLTRIGSYVFVMRHQQNGERTFSAPIDIRPVGTHSVTFAVTDLDCATATGTGEIQLIFENPAVQRAVSLYKLDDTGARILPARYEGNNLSLFTGLEVGSYEVAYTAQVASQTCTFVKRPISINPPANPLRAFVGVTKDKTCNANGKYTVSVNNVMGGSGSYEYDFGTGYQNQPTAQVDGNITVKIKDLSGCELIIPVTMQSPQAPTVSVSTPTYDCVGFGTVTVTAIAPPGQTHSYTYSVNTTTGAVQASVFTLPPGTHTIYVHYKPTGITPNVLFKEDFGVGNDVCGSDLGYPNPINDLVCEKNVAVGMGKYAITNQAQPVGAWVVPSDAQGVGNGRYMVVHASTSNAVVFRKHIKNVVPNERLRVSVRHFNMLPTASPQFNVELIPVGASSGIVKQLIVTSTGTPTWIQSSIDFTDVEITQNEYIVLIKNATGNGVVALDNIEIEQNIKLCDTTETVPVVIDEGKKLEIEVLGTTAVSCHGGNDGSLRIFVHNPPTNVEYSINNGITWTPTVLVDGVFTITHLAATESTTVYVRDVNKIACKVEATYVITQPAVPLSLRVVEPINPVRCDAGNIASITFEAIGGNSEYTQFTYQSTTMPTPQVVGVYNGRYSQPMPLSPGVYTITVTDVKGCSTETSFEVEKKEIEFEVVYNPCHDGNGTDVTVNVLNGNGGYVVNRSGETTWHTVSNRVHTFEGLQVGTYTITLNDNSGCKTSTVVNIYPPLTLTVSQTSAIDCVASPNSTFVLTAHGGVPGDRTFVIYTTNRANVYTEVTTVGSTYTFTSTDFGKTYFFDVKYTEREQTCSYEYSQPFRVASRPAFKATPLFKVKGAYCADNGYINTSVPDIVNQSTGVAPFNVEVYANDGTDNPTGAALNPIALATGNYVVVITDARGCTAMQPVVVPSLPQAQIVTVTTTPIACGVLAQANIVISAGGDANSNFSLIVKTTSETVYSATGILSSQLPTTITVSNLHYDEYEVILQDMTSPSCQNTYHFKTGLAPDAIVTASTTVVGCTPNSGELIVQSYRAGTGLTHTGNYVAIYKTTIDVNDPTSPGWYQFNPPVATTLPTTGQAGEKLEHTFTGLIPGAWYEFIIVSETPSGDPCWLRGGATIPVPTSSTLSMTTTKGTIACSGTSSGTIFFTLKDWKSSTTGITWQVYTYPDYDPVAGVGMSGNITVGSSMTSVSGNVNGLAPGRYVIVFEENNGGCVNATPPIAIPGPEPLVVHQVSITKEHVYCTTDIGDQAEITVDRVSGGLPDYLFLVQPISFATPPAVGDFTHPQPGQFVSALGSQKILVSKSGTYDLYVKDSGDCIVRYGGASLIISDAPQPTINSVRVNVCQATNNQYDVRVDVTRGEPTLLHFYKLEPGGLAPVQQQSPYDRILLGGLNPGVYTLTYSNIRGCETSTTFEVKSPMQVGNANVTRVLTCATTSPAEIVIPNITGGTGTYTYEVVRVEDDGSTTPFIGQTTTTATTITVTVNVAGSYELWVMDSDMEAIGCNSIRRSFTIESAKVPQVVFGSLKVTNVSCSSAPEGTIELMATPIDIAPMTFTIVSMRDLGTGVETATSILPTSVISNQARFTGLLGSQAGILYTIRIEGTNGCFTTQQAVIASPPPLQVGATALTPQQFTCSTSAALIASLQFDATQITGGVAPYTWQFIDRATNAVIGENSASVLLSDVNGGTYYVRVKDSSGGCATGTTDVTIYPAFTLANVTVATVTPITCAVNETIAVSVEATPQYIPGTEIVFTVKRLSDGLVTSAVYSSTVATTHITHTLPMVFDAGDYEITAENRATSCGRSKTVHKVADLSNKYDITMSNQKQPTCFRGDDGEITLTVVDRKPAIGGDTSASGFTYTVTYSVNGTITTGTIVAGSSSITLTGLKEGRYSIEIQSFVNSCKTTSSFVVPVSAEQISVNAYPAPIPQVSCLNDKGNIMVEVTGGQAPYEVTLSSLATTFTKTVNRNRVLFDNLEVGVYSVTVRDALGCMDFIGTATAELVTPDPLTASITVEDVHCKDEANGKITISNIQGGSGSTVFLFELDNGTTPAIEQSTPVFENLKAGIYTLKITDGMGCWTQTTVEVWEPNYLYAAVDVSGSDRLICYGEADARVAITAQGGVQPYKMDVYSKDGRRVTPVSYVSGVPADPRIASPVSIVTDPILEAGEYYVTIIDVNGCSTQTVKFTVEEFPNIEPREVYQEKSCDENVFTDAIKVRFPTPIDLTNVTYELKTQAGAITSGTLSRTTDVTTIGYIHDYDRTSETQTLKVIYTYTHSDGSQTEQCEQVYVVTDIEDIQALTVTRVTNLGLNTIEVKTTGGVEPYTYYFNGREQGSNPVYIMKINDPGRVDPDSRQIIKEVDVQVVDALGCTRTLTIEEVYHDIRVPNFFTPDGDGINDTWKPINIENYPKAVIYIFDRNGRKITTLTPMDSWDGIYDKKHMPSGDYWYILELNTLEDTRKFYGNFTLYR